MSTERLQKFLAGAGVASRRKAEEMIAAGRVKVNNAVAKEPGTKVDPARDLVTVDGKPIHPREEERYYLLYKPSGCVTTMKDPEGRPTAAEYLDVKERVFPVGRLDYDAEGAVLFTTDGELANRLAHPRYGHQRVYLVKVKPPGDDETALHQALARMTQGLRLEDGPAKALQAVVHEEAEKNVWIKIVVGEGRNHLVKRLCEAVGLPVLRLFRPEFGGVSVAGLRAGGWRALEPDEVRTLKRAGGLGPKGGDEPSDSRAPALPLPKAARRHGHGPPAPPSREPAVGAVSGRPEARKAAPAAPFRKLVKGRTGAGPSAPRPPKPGVGARTGGKAGGGARRPQGAGKGGSGRGGPRR